MFDDIMTPKDSAFFDWSYGADECIEQLDLLTHSAAPVISSVSEWVSLSLETQAVAYYQNDFDTVKRLIKAISSAVLAFEPKSLQDFPTLLHTGLRAVLCQPPQEVDATYLVELYRMLPRIPTVKNLDIHVMFQCHFGFTNALSGWRTHFKRYMSEHSWQDYNAVQLNAGIAFINERLVADQATLTELEAQFPAYVVATEDTPLAAEWFPWLLWFVKGFAVSNSEG